MTEKMQKPVIKVADYKKADGHKAWVSDVEELTLGLSKNEKGETEDLTGKIRHDDDEDDELSLTRILDMAILTVQTSKYFQDAYRHEKFYDPANPLIDIIGVQGSRMTVTVDTDNPDIDKDILEYYDTLQKDGELIGERFRILKRLLEEAGY